MTEIDHSKYLVYKCLAGSHAYGTNIPGSDTDTRGVFIAPPEFTLSCFQSVEQVQSSEIDETIFELKKFLKLSAECNPNIIELLFTDDKNVLFIDPVFKKIRDNRHLFLSKKARHSFSGYAHSQLHRIKGHHKWIAKPQPAEHPRLGDYCKIVTKNGSVITDPATIRDICQKSFAALTFGGHQFRLFQSPEFFADKLGVFTDDEIQVRGIDVAEDVLDNKAEYIGFLILNMESFKKVYSDWKHYWEWKKNRNPDRAKLEEQFMFDTKHAMHLVRLLKMSEEILEKGEVIVFRPDAQELLDIRNGKFNYQELLDWAEKSEQRLEAMYEKSTLQYSANYKAIDKLYREVVLEYWDRHGLLKEVSNA